MSNVQQTQPPFASAYSTDKVPTYGSAEPGVAPLYGAAPAAAPTKLGWWFRIPRGTRIALAAVAVIVVVGAAVGGGVGASVAHKNKVSSAASLTVEQVLQKCAPKSACAADASNMSTLETCAKTGSLSDTCCNALAGLSESCSTCVVSYQSGINLYNSNAEACYL